MKHPGFLEGVAVAMSAALTASVAHPVLSPLFGSEWTLRLIIGGLGLGYVLYLLHRAREHVGRITTTAVWLLLAGLTASFISSLTLYLAAHLGMVWLVRTLYHRSGVLAAVADLALNTLAWMGGVWALLHSGSLFLGVWTFFLVQALFVVVPRRSGAGKAADTTAPRHPDPFQQAQRNAETALRRLANLY